MLLTDPPMLPGSAGFVSVIRRIINPKISVFRLFIASRGRTIRLSLGHTLLELAICVRQGEEHCLPVKGVWSLAESPRGIHLHCTQSLRFIMPFVGGLAYS